MESTQEVSKKVGQAAFIHIPDLDLLKSATSTVGHAGIYEPDDEDDDIDAADVDIEVVNTRELKANGMKIMLSVEDGIKTLVEELAKDKENHLPNSRVGVYVHYLIKGVKEDFNIAFDRTPASIYKKSSTRTLKAKEDKIPFLSKKDKNELLAKTTWDYWSNLVSEGSLTMGEAQKEMIVFIEKRNEYEALGYYFSKNKTEGPKFFNWKEIIENSVDCENPTKLYTFNKIEILVPNLMDEFYNPEKRVSKLSYITEGLKTKLLPTLLELATFNKITLDFFYAGGEPGGMEPIKINSMENLTDYMNITNELKEYKINGVHLVKIAQSGMMKGRHICFDIIDKAGNRQLSLYDKQGAKTSIKNTRTQMEVFVAIQSRLPKPTS